jgi:lysophospholipase L1-like esterase
MAQSNYVIGDSLSVLVRETLPPWPDYLWGDDVENLAVSATTSELWWQGRSDVWAPLAGPDQTWWILLGTNDVSAEVLFDLPNHYADRLPAIVEELLEAGVAEVHIIHSPKYAHVHATPAEQRIITEEIGLQREEVDLPLCDELEDVSCGPDLWAAFEAGDEHFAADGLHISDVGVVAIAELVPEPEPRELALVALGTLAGLRRRAGRRQPARGH